jgi:predicted nucleotidyltransferase
VKSGEGLLRDGGVQLALTRPLETREGLHGRRETTAARLELPRPLLLVGSNVANRAPSVGDVRHILSNNDRMTDQPDVLAANVARDFAATLAGRWQAHLGDVLLGAYLIGSLGHGGFSRRYSDIDVAVITEAGLTPTDLDAMRAAAAALSSELAAKLSIFWTDRTFSAGRFPPLDRADYLDHGALLVERERVTPARPGLAEVREYLTGRPFEAWSQGAAQFAILDTLEPKSHKPYLRAHLYPARFVYSFMTGRMESNDAAVEWLKDRSPPGLDVALIADALACRRAAADPDALFAARTALPRQVAACAALICESETERP